MRESRRHSSRLFPVLAGYLIVFHVILFNSASIAKQTTSRTFKGAGRASASTTEDAYLLLASAISDHVAILLNENEQRKPEQRVDADFVTKVASSLLTMSNAQGALKTLDGAAHEMYQRSQKKQRSKFPVLSKEDSKVTGRTTRSAVRTGCVADAFFACELCELIECPELTSIEHALSHNGTLYGKQVLLNVSLPMETNGSNYGISYEVTINDNPEVTLIALYDPNYIGGAGLSHGGIDQLIAADIDEKKSSERRGRILVLLTDSLFNNLEATLRYLNVRPFQLVLRAGLVANEAVSVHQDLWKTAGHVLKRLAPTLLSLGVLNNTNSSSPSTKPPMAIHFVGRSLSGGIAGLAAAILDGTLPMPPEEKHQKRGKKPGIVKLSPTTKEEAEKSMINLSQNSDNVAPSSQSVKDINGLGRGRTSALILGPPPCLSSNVRAAFITSIIYGDDIVPRATQNSFHRLCQRVSRHMKGGMFGKRIGLVSDAVSLTMSSLKSHVAGSDGEESRLSLPGRGFLVHPRR